jgi:DNA repair exonuclease SbcCD ATPase subunit
MSPIRFLKNQTANFIHHIQSILHHRQGEEEEDPLSSLPSEEEDFIPLTETMPNMDAASVFAVGSAMCAVVLGGVFMYVNHAEEKMIQSSKRVTEESLAKLDQLDEQLKKKESKIEDDLRMIDEQRTMLKELEENLKNQTREIEKREAAVAELEKTLKARTEEIEKRESALADAESALAAEKEELAKAHKTEPEISSEEEGGSTPGTSEAEKRNKMIEEELMGLIKEADENELEDPFDEDSIEAMKKAAYKICYLKKYYDVMKDEFIYFPSVTKTVVNYTLIEEAEKFYYEEEDEYPQDLAIGLRSVASMRLVEEDDDVDEEYMSALAQDVVL